ncbi:phosphatidate cytidylyltransferase [Legionella beliardensis]|uniref:Phosphatidate cytidylyltransferase n=1 Tax=Legionella beliardensis TaxID=91822 RepID=A0A378HYS7_9GAMM|nr:phosphatidate cytidylyltransferase [Legionella beliardensis]STX28058.1 phosphatidate cytidylyltransferase [Legionella beliardensis]
MFKQRLLTTLILIPLVLIGIYYGNHLLLRTIIFLLVLGCSLEWLQLIPASEIFAKTIFIIGLVILFFLIPFIYFYWLCLGLITWGFIFVLIQQYPRLQKLWAYPSVVTFFGLLLLPLFGQSLMSIFAMNKGRSLIVYLLFLVWAADIGAYLMGKFYGRHKLIPQVSPGKTIEGFIGGFVLALLVAIVGYYLFQPAHVANWFIIAMGIILVALFGDLFISMLKRRRQIKDTGYLLPGHGGLLDRLDSLIAAVPFFYCGMRFFAPGI